MSELLKDILLVIIGVVVGSCITSRWERWKGWKAYEVVRLEIDRNIQLLENLHQKAKYVGEAQQKEVADFFGKVGTKLPIEVQNLANLPFLRWSYGAWESQLSLVALILSEKQVREIFECQVRLEESSMVHQKIADLVQRLGIDSREPGLRKWDEWESVVKQVTDAGNPLPPVCTSRKRLDLFCFRK